jgi:hypothetical protein
MTFLHFRYRDRLGLLASHALEPLEANSVLKHVADCASCRSELAELSALATTLVEDAALDRPLPISSDALRTRVLARIHEGSHQTAPARAWSHASAMAALGLVGLGIAAGVLVTRRAAPAAAPASTSTQHEVSSETALNNTAFYERLEKTHLRANAARYLSEAQDVLIQVSAAADCPDSPKDSVDVARESQTSRTLLKRRAALVSGSGETLVAARGVMEEVEGLLQEVADLPQCSRRSEVNAIARRMDRKNLLMKIDLVTQELAAP